MPALILQGHVDVVPTGDVAKWEGADPFSASIEGDVLHGRGACDMKGGLVAVLVAVRALRAARVELVRPLAVHTVVSEEDGGLGAFATLLRGHRGDCAIIPEPTSGKVVVANAGALTFRLTVHGRAAHGSVRHEGVSAVEALYPLLRALDDLEARRNRNGDALFAGVAVPYPISIGTVRAGDWPSSVPDLLVAEGRMGVVIDEDPDEARRELGDGDRRGRRARSMAAREPASRRVGRRAVRERPVAGGASAARRGAVGGSRRERWVRAAPVPGAGPWGSDLRLYAGIGGIAVAALRARRREARARPSRAGGDQRRDPHRPHARARRDAPLRRPRDRADAGGIVARVAGGCGAGCLLHPAGGYSASMYIGLGTLLVIIILVLLLT